MSSLPALSYSIHTQQNKYILTKWTMPEKNQISFQDVKMIYLTEFINENS